MPAATLCRLHQHRETFGTVGQRKTKYACVVEADESMRIRMEGSQSKNHEDHNAGKGVNSLSRFNLVHKFIPMPRAMKIPDANVAAEKNWKTRENTVMAADVSQEQKWGDRWNKDQGPYCSFCVVSGSLSSQEFRVGTTIPQIQRSSCTPRRHCEGWFRSYAVFTEQGSSASQMTAAEVMDVSRLPGCAGQAADVVSASTQLKMEDAPSLLKIPKSECPDILETSTKTQMA